MVYLYHVSYIRDSICSSAVYYIIYDTDIHVIYELYYIYMRYCTCVQYMYIKKSTKVRCASSFEISGGILLCAHERRCVHACTDALK